MYQSVLGLDREVTGVSLCPFLRQSQVLYYQTTNVLLSTPFLPISIIRRLRKVQIDINLDYVKLYVYFKN